MKFRIVVTILLLILSNSFQLNTSAQTTTSRPNVIFLGASNTVEDIDTIPRNGSYITALRNFNPTWKSVNLIDKGNSGWSSSNYYGEPNLVNNTVFEHQPDYIIVVFGGNDFIRNRPPDWFKIRYEWLLDAILFLDTNSLIKQIFVANIFWGTIEVSDERINRFEKYQEIISNVSRDYEFPILDFFSSTENRPEYYLDPIHLNDLGHRAIAEEVNRVVQPFLNGTMERSNGFPQITELYSDTYTGNNPGFLMWITSFTFGLIIIINRIKNRNLI
ncbi:MAG: SGNH/GDSL hydrolase family protein [Candidatus Kariarchaeaceae archaeon]